ncbi:hypothetical protein AK812_SmicGene6945 [Symbiodinium microadriaticum]|uniref:Uncharacterized protein n=1 Tax=Symbiodinium microadriaticum TaxID=2951 RepID=A0A1Q9EPR6_SYMMI|nr:hypothetical protein AK812_SmicGene6945 [Symbiodinium microadriaticum]
MQPAMIAVAAIAQERRCEMEDFDAPLKVAAARQVANPDVIRPDGVASPMPGRLARRYKELGGPDAFFVGKPGTCLCGVD